MNQNGSVEVHQKAGVAYITFFHPQSNSLPGSLLIDLAKEITASGNDASVKVIVLQSKGEKVFCAGASFDELLQIENEEQGMTFFSGFARVINAMRKAPKFIVVRIQGKAVGGGVGLAASADYAIAHSSAFVKLSELAVGIGPFVVGPAVERKMGKSAFTKLTVHATQWQSAQWAEQHGLFAEVHDTIEKVDLAVSKLVENLKFSNPEAMKMLKKIFWEGTESWDTLLPERAGMSGQLVLSAFTRNAIEAFKKKS